MVDFGDFFVCLKFTYLVTLFDCKLQVFKKSPKLTTFGPFLCTFGYSKLFSSQC